MTSHVWVQTTVPDLCICHRRRLPDGKLEESPPQWKTAAEAGVHIVSGDTKVAGKGQVDGVFITTTGMGQIEDGVKVGGTLAQPGDAIIVTGDVGRHGCTILLAREDFRDRSRCHQRLRAALESSRSCHEHYPRSPCDP